MLRCDAPSAMLPWKMRKVEWLELACGGSCLQHLELWSWIQRYIKALIKQNKCDCKRVCVCVSHRVRGDYLYGVGQGYGLALKPRCTRIFALIPEHNSPTKSSTCTSLIWCLQQSSPTFTSPCSVT